MKTGMPNSREIERKFAKRLPENSNGRDVMSSHKVIWQQNPQEAGRSAKGQTAPLTFKVAAQIAGRAQIARAKQFARCGRDRWQEMTSCVTKFPGET
jgi:hypothetical protein